MSNYLLVCPTAVKKSCHVCAAIPEPTADQKSESVFQCGFDYRQSNSLRGAQAGIKHARKHVLWHTKEIQPKQTQLWLSVLLCDIR